MTSEAVNKTAVAALCLYSAAAKLMGAGRVIRVSAAICMKVTPSSNEQKIIHAFALFVCCWIVEFDLHKSLMQSERVMHPV